MPTLRASIEIAASAERVWKILGDLDRYGEWNPFTPKIETDHIVGHPVILHVDFGARTLHHQVEILRRWEPGVELRWGMTMGPRWWFRAERWQRVESLGPNRCRYSTEDAFEGLFAPIVLKLYGDKVQKGFEAMAEALRRRAEG